MLVKPDGHLRFLVAGEFDNGSVLDSPSKLPRWQWLHVAGTLDDATGVQALYVNGTLVTSTVTAIRPFAKLKEHHAALTIGADIPGVPDGESYLFRGSIDEVRISDVALDPAQFLPPP